MKNERPIQLRIELTSELHTMLADAAAKLNISVERMAADCIAQSLETALRHRVLIDRQEQLDEALLILAEFVGGLPTNIESHATRFRFGDRR